MFRTLDRHVLREWLTWLAIVLGATFGLLMVIDVFDKLPDLQRLDASADRIVWYFVVRLPWFLSFVLPVAVLVSLLYALGLLHRNNEIVAMRAAGIGVWRITRWVWGGAAVLSALLFYLNSTLIPWSVEQLRVVETNIELDFQARQAGAGEEIGLEYNLTYDNRQHGRLWFISRFSRSTHNAYGIQISLLDAERREASRVLARTGYWDAVERTWVLRDGVEVHQPTDREAVRPAQFDRREFPDFQEDPEWMLLLHKKPRDLSFYELDRIIDSPDTVNHPQRAAFTVQYHKLLAGGLSCLIAAGLAVPFAVSGVRVNPAVGVSKSLGLFAAFFFLSGVARLLGEQQTLAPWLAAWLPNFVMIALAGWYLYRAR